MASRSPFARVSVRVHLEKVTGWLLWAQLSHGRGEGGWGRQGLSPKSTVKAR